MRVWTFTKFMQYIRARRNWLVSAEVSVSNVGIRFRTLVSISSQGRVICHMLVSILTQEWVTCHILVSILSWRWVACWYWFLLYLRDGWYIGIGFGFNLRMGDI